MWCGDALENMKAASIVGLGGGDEKCQFLTVNVLSPSPKARGSAGVRRQIVFDRALEWPGASPSAGSRGRGVGLFLLR